MGMVLVKNVDIRTLVHYPWHYFVLLSTHMIATVSFECYRMQNKTRIIPLNQVFQYINKSVLHHHTSVAMVYLNVPWQASHGVWDMYHEILLWSYMVHYVHIVNYIFFENVNFRPCRWSLKAELFVHPSKFCMHVVASWVLGKKFAKSLH